MKSQTENRVRTAAACAAFVYPLYMAAQVVLNALPAMVRAAVLRQPLAYFRVTPLSIAAGAASSATAGSGGQDIGLTASLQMAAVAIVTIALLALVRRRTALAGLSLAILGYVGLQNPTWRIFFQKQISLETVLPFIFFLAIICAGLRWMVAGEETFLERVATMLSTFNLPLLVMGLVWTQILPFRSARFFWVMIPAAVATLLVSAWPVRRVSEERFFASLPSTSLPSLVLGTSRASRMTTEAGWRTIAAGVICTALVIFGVVRGGPAVNQTLREAELAKGRAEVAKLPQVPPDAPYEKIFFQKGVSFTAEFPAVYTSEAARTMLRQLPSYGVNAIALVPFGGATRNPPGVRFFSTTNSWESDEGIEQLARVANSINIRVMLKPQLWARGGEWLYEDIPDAAERRQWFAEYQTFIEHYAQLAKQIHADVFCIGVELRKLVQYDAEWRRLIARVREIYPGPLVYAANFGTEFESVAFWDALDYIGLDNYYPLPDDFSAESVLRVVESVQRKFQKPVVFTEAGFASLESTHRQPWDETPGKLSLDEQARCYEAVFGAFYNKPWFEGVYWWKVGTNGRGGANDGSHTPWGKPAMEVVKRWYSEGRR